MPMNHEIILTKKRKVSCNGHNLVTGHPLIYLEIKEQQIQCPYCSIIYKFEQDANN